MSKQKEVEAQSLAHFDATYGESSKEAQRQYDALANAAREAVIFALDALLRDAFAKPSIITPGDRVSAMMFGGAAGHLAFTASMLMPRDGGWRALEQTMRDGLPGLITAARARHDLPPLPEPH